MNIYFHEAYGEGNGHQPITTSYEERFGRQ
jgi:hypothetical protein